MSQIARLNKRSHSNPCFWTAYWNVDYYNSRRAGENVLVPREQSVFSLNLRGDKVLSTNVENVHWEKGLAVAEITPEAMKDFVKRNHPEKYDDFMKYMEERPETLLLDFEDFWTGIEATTSAYKSLITVITNEKLESSKHKAPLACFIVIQNMRSHAILRSGIEFYQEHLGMQLFEYYLNLRWLLSDPSFLFKVVNPIATAKWTIYVTKEHMFPLSESPILIDGHSIMVALSPRMLLSIDRRENWDKLWMTEQGVSEEIIEEYKRRCISNAFKEIIFQDSHLLERWREAPEYRRRMKVVRSMKSYNRLIQKEASREIWKINAYRDSLS